MSRISAAVAVLAVSGAAALGWMTSVAPAAPPRCRTADLQAHVVFGPGSGSAGHRNGRLVFRNTGSSACTFHGYPGVSFVGRHGRQLGVPAAREPGQVSTITVRAGRRAGSRFILTDVGVFDPAACRPVRARGVRVYPPDERTALFVPHRLRVCRGDEVVATIGPVVRLRQLP